MKKLIPSVLAAVAALMLSSVAEAKILTFDDVTTTNLAYVPMGYGELSWQNVAVADSTRYAYNALGIGAFAGFRTGAKSGTFTAFNSGMKTAIIGAADTFDFEGAYFTSAWSDRNTVTATGYLDGVLEYTKTIRIDTKGPVWLEADFSDIDELRISSTNWQFAMDNFTYSLPAPPPPDPGPVPEPGAFLLMGAGLAGLAFMKKRLRV